MHSPECPGWFSFLSLNAVDEKGAHFARNSTCMSQEPQHSSASSQRLKGWRRRTSSPERGFLRLGLGSAEGLPWHVPHSRPSSQQLPWTPLSCRCWLPSSAVLPASWLVLCWRCCCWPLERWMGSSETLVSVQGLTLPGRSDLLGSGGLVREQLPLAEAQRCCAGSTIFPALSPWRPRPGHPFGRGGRSYVIACASGSDCSCARVDREDRALPCLGAGRQADAVPTG